MAAWGPPGSIRRGPQAGRGNRQTELGQQQNHPSCGGSGKHRTSPETYTNKQMKGFVYVLGPPPTFPTHLVSPVGWQAEEQLLGPGPRFLVYPDHLAPVTRTCDLWVDGGLNEVTFYCFCFCLRRLTVNLQPPMITCDQLSSWNAAAPAMTKLARKRLTTFSVSRSWLASLLLSLWGGGGWGVLLCCMNEARPRRSEQTCCSSACEAAPRCLGWSSDTELHSPGRGGRRQPLAA